MATEFFGYNEQPMGGANSKQVGYADANANMESRTNVIFEQSPNLHPSFVGDSSSTTSVTTDHKPGFWNSDEPACKKLRSDESEPCYEDDPSRQTELAFQGQEESVAPTATDSAGIAFVDHHQDVQPLQDNPAAVSCDDGYIEDNEPIVNVIKELSQESKMLCMQWLQLFDDSEKFEKFCPSRLDRILQEAKQLEESLTKQKETLRNRLKGLSKTLQML